MRFLVSIWDPSRGSRKFHVEADSYDAVWNTHISMLPPSSIGTVEPDDPEYDRTVDRCVEAAITGHTNSLRAERDEQQRIRDAGL